MNTAEIEKLREDLKRITSKADMNRFKSALRNCIYLVKKYSKLFHEETEEDKSFIEEAEVVLKIALEEEEKRWPTKST